MGCLRAYDAAREPGEVITEQLEEREGRENITGRQRVPQRNEGTCSGQTTYMCVKK